MFISDSLRSATEEAGQEVSSLHVPRPLTPFLYRVSDETFPIPDEVQEASQRHRISTQQSRHSNKELVSPRTVQAACRDVR